MTEQELIEYFTDKVAEVIADTEVRQGYWRALIIDERPEAMVEVRRCVRAAGASLTVLAPMIADRDAEIEQLRRQVEVLGKACQRDAQGVKDRQVLKVTWHPDAVRRAVDHAIDITQAAESPDAVFRLPGGHLSWMDLACLVDAGRAALSMAVGSSGDGGTDV